MDENLIAYGGDLSVQGKPCEFPFMMNEKYDMTSHQTKKLTHSNLFRYYENCTRETEDPGTFVKRHWCPSADYVNTTNLQFTGNTTYMEGLGYCNKPYIPSNDCPDHYYPVRKSD